VNHHEGLVSEHRWLVPHVLHGEPAAQVSTPILLALLIALKRPPERPLNAHRLLLASAAPAFSQTARTGLCRSPAVALTCGPSHPRSLVSIPPAILSPRTAQLAVSFAGGTSSILAP
jgi:hypothetical protein